MVDAGDGSRLAPDDAFAVLGNETRLAILRALGDADSVLPFSTLYDRVSVDDTGQFNYHLDKLTGHFVVKTDDGYTLTRPGRRIVEAVLSGAVTEDPRMERTEIGRTCEHCGAPVEAAWRAGSVELYCTSCPGAWGQTRGGGPEGREAPAGYLGRLPLPPAGLRDRDPNAIVRAAHTWTTLEVIACGAGICPRCSATVDQDIDVCEDHRATDGLCPACERHHAVTVGFHCRNCIFSTGGGAGIALIGTPELLSFVVEQGYDPIAPTDTGAIERVHNHYEETVLSTDPFEAEFVFSTDHESLRLRVDEHLDIVAADRE